jgi:putative ubiquitin-RnfH superfamily antitoxin RatB of RatAB toxin-antitoxin module
LRERQRVVEVEFNDGLTALEAVERSGLLAEFADLAGGRLDLGIFGRVVRPDHRLAPGDRVEIYRPLRADPRDTRRRMAAGARRGGLAR